MAMAEAESPHPLFEGWLVLAHFEGHTHEFVQSGPWSSADSAYRELQQLRKGDGSRRYRVVHIVEQKVKPE